jgi:hypothetical protein
MVRLIGNLWIVSNDRLTHPWDACSYLVGGDEPALIDCGSSLGYPALKQALRSIGLQPKDIRNRCLLQSLVQAVSHDLPVLIPLATKVTTNDEAQDYEASDPSYDRQCAS